MVPLSLVLGLFVLACVVPARARFTCEVSIRAPAEAVEAHFTEPQRLLGLHPLLVTVEPVERKRDAQGREVVSYAPVDMWKVGPWQYRLQYHVETVRLGPGHLESHVRAQGVRLHNTLRLEEREGVTRLREEVIVSGGWLLAQVSRREGLRSHQLMLAHLQQRLEARA